MLWVQSTYLDLQTTWNSGVFIQTVETRHSDGGRSSLDITTELTRRDQQYIGVMWWAAAVVTLEITSRSLGKIKEMSM